MSAKKTAKRRVVKATSWAIKWPDADDRPGAIELCETREQARQVAFIGAWCSGGRGRVIRVRIQEIGRG